MRLHAYTVAYLSVVLALVLGAWAVWFYLQMIDEIYDSIDDGLDNYKTLIIRQAAQDPRLLLKAEFQESNYAIRKLPEALVRHQHDRYVDTLMFMQNEQDFEPVRLLKTAFRASDGSYYELRVVASMVEEDDLIEDLLYALAGLYAAVLVAAFFINFVLLRRIWRPFHLQLARLDAFRLGTPAPPSPRRTPVLEFQALDAAVNALINRVSASYDSQRQFIENAAHETQTPLALSINKLELLAEDEGLPSAVLPKVGAVIDGLERIVRLNKALLLLAKIENQQFPQTEPVDLNALINLLAEDFAEQAERLSLDFDYTCVQPASPVMAPALAQVLVTNLIKNALTHTAPGGWVKVQLTAHELTVENSGSGPLDGDRIFKRFYKATAHEQSTGLGLAIVKAVADVYGFRVTYHFPGRHRFTVLF